MRYITPFIERDLGKKLIFLVGPRQVGKTTLARGLVRSDACYLNYDIAADQRAIREIAWPKNRGLVVLDELHKYLRWKKFLKGVIDQYKNEPPLLVTGSARLETFRKGGDALTGRSFLYRLHPIDPLEAFERFGAKSLLEAARTLLSRGGFPEAYLRPQEAARLREDRFQVVVREDVRDLSTISELRGMQLLVELLRERVGAGINYSHLASDLGVSPPTVKKWIELLERLFVIFLIYPFSRNLARSIRREPKVYFYDCAASSEGEGPRYENLLAATLLKYIQLQNDSTGSRLNLYYYRDKDGREVDFVVTEGLRPKLLIEAKLAETNLHPGLHYLSGKLAQTSGFQVVLDDIKARQVGENIIISINSLQEILGHIQKG